MTDITVLSQNKEQADVMLGQWFVWAKCGDLHQLCLVQGKSTVAMVHLQTGKYFADAVCVENPLNITIAEFGKIVKHELFLPVKAVHITYEME